MSGSELIPDADSPILPASVSAAHLHASASTLAHDIRRDRVAESIHDLDELSEVLRHLVTGQRDLASALTRLGIYLRNRHARGALAAAPSADLLALAEVLAAAGNAASYSAEALAQSAPVMDILLDTVGKDTRL